MPASSGKPMAIGGLVLLVVWVVSAFLGADYFMEVLDPQRIEKGIGWPVALVVFGLITTTIWFGLVVLTLVIAWKKWSHPGDSGGPDDRGKSSGEP